MRPLRVVQLVPKLDTGGAEKSALEIAEALVMDGHEAIIVAELGPWSERAKSIGATLLPWPIGRKSWRALLAMAKLRKLISGELLGPVDIVHSRSRLPSWLLYGVLKTLAKARRPVWINTVHGMHSVNRYSAIQHAADAVICVSQTTLDFLRSNYPNDPLRNVTVIERGADAKVYRQGANAPSWRDGLHQQYPKLRNTSFLLLAGRGTRLKGHQQAIQLLADLHQSGQKLALFFAGVVEAQRESYVQELRQLASTYQVSDYVIFSPSRNDLPALYAESALVLQLSNRPESFGRTVAEALLCGAMVLGWDHGGVGQQLRRAFPMGAVPLSETLDISELAKRAQVLLREQPKPDLSHVSTLQQMQAQTLQLYRRMCAKP